MYRERVSVGRAIACRAAIRLLRACRPIGSRGGKMNISYCPPILH